MGQNRTDTPVQLAAKRRHAERRRCPECGRGSALRIGAESWTDPHGTQVRVTVVECRWTDRGLCAYRKTSTTSRPAQRPR